MQLPHTVLGSVGSNAHVWPVMVYSCPIRVWTKAGTAAAPADPVVEVLLSTLSEFC